MSHVAVAAAWGCHQSSSKLDHCTCAPSSSREQLGYRLPFPRWFLAWSAPRTFLEKSGGSVMSRESLEWKKKATGCTQKAGCRTKQQGFLIQTSSAVRRWVPQPFAAGAKANHEQLCQPLRSSEPCSDGTKSPTALSPYGSKSPVCTRRVDLPKYALWAPLHLSRVPLRPLPLVPAAT